MSISVNELRQYVAAGMSVLIEGPHGIGKTSAIRQVCSELGYSMWYANMSTIDVNTHLIGVPVVNDDQTDLKMVRPHTIDQADVIFLDEINRTGSFAADVMNAVMELVIDGAINGEPLPNLKAVVAACNPDDGTYNVVPIDPATIDRFDVFIRAEASVDQALIAKECGNARVAKAVCDWWGELRHNSEYVSPRRVGKIASGAVKVEKWTPQLAKALVGPNASNLPVTALFRKVEAALAPVERPKARRNRTSESIDKVVKDVIDVAFDKNGNYVETSELFNSTGQGRKLMKDLTKTGSKALLNALVAHPGFPDDEMSAAVQYTNTVSRVGPRQSVLIDFLAPVQAAYKL